MSKAKVAVRRLICLFLIYSLLLCLGGCNSMVERPDSMTKPSETDSDIPVGAETDPSHSHKRVAITFDDGPNHYDDRTKKVVDELDKYGYRATFFVVGDRIPGGDALAYAVEKGNEIGIHGYTHSVYYDTCSEDEYRQELNKTEQAIRKQLPGYQINLMRPVGGRITEERAKTTPYSIILWSVDSADWENKYYAGISDEEADARVACIVDNVMSSVSDGDIILLHDIYESTYDATKIILKRLYEEGYEVVTVSELLGDDLQKGAIYSSAYD